MTASRPLNFTAEREQETTSFERADPTASLIEQRSPQSWTVSLPDGDGTHHVTLIQDYGVYIGRCTCEGFQYNEGPCAHLCTIRKADTIGYPDVNGTPVSIERVNRDLDDELADHHDDMETVRADGARRIRR
ncbi:SWIM zinc finger family protein [Natronomonas salsuginis]|uniref:SWIM zinc finger family protein n=1 Tax=Natronomonas salsuginis TaxID=2217661 RepID=A0A4U5JJL8_9EURY|nr:SWIM zinc finger family protein [Natronomonas salsuginis]TKR27947.1 SWIM zinc finger family protein [Natronomonas salsuginis]